MCRRLNGWPRSWRGCAARTSPDPGNPLYKRNPELWLESQVRAQLTDIHAPLVPGVVYGQVPSFAAGDRGVIDLLAVEHTGRLAVMEVKASEDVHLPLQALDYWMRVKVHPGAGRFFPSGLFSGHFPDPRMAAAAADWSPSLDFHPANETVLPLLFARYSQWSGSG